tara:strand:- start:255 stop:461 length:207 start_codon:yes stop_codon:yes gene_type:complete
MLDYSLDFVILRASLEEKKLLLGIMKTSFTFNKVINDAGQLALTEGHTVLTSSPRVTPCGLLSLKEKS